MNRSILFILFLGFILFAQDERFSMEKLNDEVKQNPLEMTQQKEEEQQSSPLIIVLRIIGSLALLSGGVIGVVWLLKKSGVGEKMTVNPDASMELLEELPTAQGNSLILVRFNNKVLLLGQTDSSFTPLETVEGDSALELIAKSAGGKSVGTFRANLNKYVLSLQKGAGRG